jgi:hypothetical protein
VRAFLIHLVVWLTRLGGLVFGLFGGIGFFVSAWQERSLGLGLAGIAFVAFGAIMLSFRIRPDGRPEYQLLRRRP